MSAMSTSPIDSDGVVRCFQHALEAALKTSHTPANPDRQFYCCAKEISDPDRCKFFFWADEIDKLRGMSHTPRKRNLSRLDEQPETPLQKRRRPIEEARRSTPPPNGSSQLLMTPPNTTRRLDPRYAPDGSSSPSPLARTLRDDDEHSSQLELEFPMLPLAVDQTTSRRFQGLVEELDQLQSDIQRLERQKVAAEKTNEAKKRKIDELTAENLRLKEELAAQEDEIRDLKKMNKALLDTRPA